MADWLSALVALGRTGEPCTLVTVAEALGSTPRGSGTGMVVTGDGQHGTIGGGNLEWQATEIARELIRDGREAAVTLRRFPLGPALGQCCGGATTLAFEYLPAASRPWVAEVAAQLEAGPCVTVRVTGNGAPPGARLVVTADRAWGGLAPAAPVEAATARARALLADGDRRGSALLERVAGPDGSALLYERFAGTDFEIVLFGAGHVGSALVPVLGGLPCRIRWFDSRPGLFPDPLPANVRAAVSPRPEYEVERSPPGAYYLVMTHSHPLDYALTERILRRGDFRYAGLIGSRSKRARLEKILIRKGMSRDRLAGLTCPIGIDGVDGKHPGEIAVAVAAELLRVRDVAAAPVPVAASAKPV